MEASVAPDGSQIAFIDGTRKAVWLMGANGEDPHRVVVSEGDDTFHRTQFPWTGARVMYGRVHFVRDPSAGAGKLEVSAESCDREGRASAVVISDPGLRAGVNLPDGRFIYSLVADAWWNQGGTSLWEVRTDPHTGRPDGKPRRIYEWEHGVSLSGMSVTADGKHVAFTKAIPQSDVYVADLGADAHLNSPRRLTLDDSNDFPTNWTPDSTAVFFSSDRNGNFDIFKQALNGRVAETIVAGPEDETGPTGVSPDGAWLYYVTASKGWRLSLWRPLTVMRSASTGGLAQRVLDQPGLSVILCARSPSTRCVLIEKAATQLAVYSLDPLAGKGRKLASTETGSSFLNSLALAPDGSRLAVAMDPGRVRLLSLDGEPAHDVLISGWSLDSVPFFWAADGNGWYMSSSSSAGTDLLRVDLNGHAEVLRHQAVQQNVNAAVPSPDGRHVPFTEMTSVSNVWTIEKF
jgi:Tol biopolymer transport system component